MSASSDLNLHSGGLYPFTERHNISQPEEYNHSGIRGDNKWGKCMKCIEYEGIIEDERRIIKSKDQVIYIYIYIYIYIDNWETKQGGSGEGEEDNGHGDANEGDEQEEFRPNGGERRAGVQLQDD